MTAAETDTYDIKHMINVITIARGIDFEGFFASSPVKLHTLNHKVLGSMQTLPDEPSNHETTRVISFLHHDIYSISF